MISAMARGGEPGFVERAARAADFLLKNSRKKGRLFRSYMDGRARHNAYLDDYAFLIAGLLDLYEATSDIRWLREAIALQQTLDEQYRDEKTGGYFLTSHDHEQLLARERPGRDKAEPSGNSVAAMNLLRLHELTLDERYLNACEQLLGAFARNVRGSPEMMMAVDFLLGRSKEVVIVSPGGAGGGRASARGPAGDIPAQQGRGGRLRGARPGGPGRADTDAAGKGGPSGPSHGLRLRAGTVQAAHRRPRDARQAADGRRNGFESNLASRAISLYISMT